MEKSKGIGERLRLGYRSSSSMMHLGTKLTVFCAGKMAECLETNWAAGRVDIGLCLMVSPAVCICVTEGYQIC